MEKLDAKLLVLYAAIFMGGIALLVTDTAIALGLVLMLLGASFTLLSGLPLVRTKAAPVRIDTLDGEPSFVLDIARGKEIAVQLALFCLVGACVAMALSGSARSWVGVALFTPVALWWSYRVIRGGRAITLTPTRILLTVDDHEEFAWAEIEALRVREVDETPTLEIDYTGVDIDEFVASSAQIGQIVTLYFEEPERRAAIGTEAELARVI